MTRRISTFLVALALAPMAGADDFPPVIDTEPDKTPVMPADRAAAAFKVPEGFRVSVFATEPEVRNPIAMAWDAKGRLWIAENYTYAERSARFDLRHRDRVLIFDDSDGDGKPEKRSVFTDEVQMLTSVEVGLGGVWLMCPPRLLFVPDKDRDDKPDGAPEVVLDGFNVPDVNYHNFANGLRWGPDGWLYGRCGASSPGKVGVPGTPEGDRVTLAGGLWRFDPASKRFEVLSHGTTNPWGHDWDERGEAFFINTVCGHLWHAIPGAHFVRSHTVDPNSRAYELIDQHADHYHWDTAKDWTDSRVVTAEHDRRGGGHAHIGMMIYLGDQWPKEDRGKLFTLNMHGRRMNVERLERSGSGFVGKHEADRFFASDPKYRGLDLSYGPDGGVFVLDWNDSGECHENNGVLRTSGRIFKMTRGMPIVLRGVGDLTRASDMDLVLMQHQSNEWLVRMARRQLIDRAQAGKDVASAVAGLSALLQGNVSLLKLRALWTLHGLGKVDESTLRSLLLNPDESVRVWAIRLLTDRRPIDTVDGRRPSKEEALAPDLLDQFAAMARDDRSGLVRLALASTMQRLPASQRAAIAGPLLGRSEDANDHNLPLMIWYALIPVADADPSALARLASEGKLPTTRRLIARRLAEGLDKHPGAVNDLVAAASRSEDGGFQADVLSGLAEGLKGWRKAPRPESWESLSAKLTGSGDPAIGTKVRELGVLFGDGRALDELKRLVFDGKADLETRKAALKGLIEDRPDDLRSICEKALRVPNLNATAVRGLALFDDPAIGKALAASYRSFQPWERPPVVETLASRPAFAAALLDQMAAGSIPKGDLSAFQARQIRSMGDAALTKKLSETWGEQRDSSKEKQAAIAALKAKLPTETLSKADLGRGRLQFNKLCASCHTLHGHGGAIGPDLTGSGRDNLDYLLENILDPSATVNADFKMAVVSMADGRVLNGLVRSPTDRTITLQSQTDAIVLPRAEIEQIAPSPLSLMPEGQLDPLSSEEVRDLIAYLMNRTQAPLPPSASKD